MRFVSFPHLRAATLVAALLLLFGVALPAVPSRAEQAAGDLVPDQSSVDVGLGSGPAIADAAGVYESPPILAPRPFSHMVIRAETNVPEGAALALEVRASADGQSWTMWGPIEASDDLARPDDPPGVIWSQIVDVGIIVRYWQLRATPTPAPSGERPTLGRVEAHTVDALTGPAAPQAAQPLLAGPGKPPVVSRTAWGSPDGQGSRARPAYYPVNHLVVHHTADSNSLSPGQPNWAARVRAIWSFHTITRGWGDIGYNYLIDPNGVIYEGRAGGDDAVGFHDTANYGSMGVSMLGTYQSVMPTQATQDSLVQLLAWKAAQKDIDPLGRSYYYGCSISSLCAPHNAGASVPNIAGHRQVTPGHTSCPGDAVMNMMPDLRNRVRALMEGAEQPGDNGDLEIDERESSFSRSAANWYSAGCGAGGHAYYTFATNSPAQSTNRGTWRPNLPERGTYRVLAHVPSGCGLTPTAGASYLIRSADGDVRVVVDQGARTGWVDLGTYTFNAGTGGLVELDDLTGEALSAQRAVLFDAVRWVREVGASAEVTASYERTTLAAGELLKVTFTVRNTGGATIRGQEPRVDLSAPGSLGSVTNGHVYDEQECFAGSPNGDYPSFPKEADRFRVALGVPGWDAANSAHCADPTSDYPWRWGLNEDLPPGASQTIVGYVRLRTPGAYQLRAGLVQEYVQYFAQDVSPALVTVSAEREPPDVAAFNDVLVPAAQVYQLGPVPPNFLARVNDPRGVLLGQHVGSIAWDGGLLDWGYEGPLGLYDSYIVAQTRAFLAPASGEYTFRTTSDDGSWLLVNGQVVVSNYGLQGVESATGTVWLNAGMHAVSVVYFELGGMAAAGYDVRLPGAASFQLLSDGLSSASRLGWTFGSLPTLTLVADDRGGSGVAKVRWSFDGASWQEQPGVVAQVGPLGPGSYRLRYQSVDAAGNVGPVRELVFAVDPSMVIRKGWLPEVMRS